MSARILHVLLHLSFLCDFYDIFLLFNTVTPKPVMGPQEVVKLQQINIWKKMFKNLPRGTIWTIQKMSPKKYLGPNEVQFNIGKLLNVFSSRTAMLLLHVYNHLYILISLYQGHNGTYFFLIIISSKIYIRNFKVYVQ